jgi:hypothetical protein
VVILKTNNLTAIAPASFALLCKDLRLKPKPLQARLQKFIGHWDLRVNVGCKVRSVNCRCCQRG